MSERASAGLVTPEAVLLGLEPAGLGSRAMAWLIDTAIVAVLIAGIAIGAGLVGDGAGATAALVIFLVASGGVFFGYPIGFEVLWQGRTPGKAVLRLRVVTTDGVPVGFRHSAVRAALSLVDIWGTGASAGVLSVLLTERAQRLGDLAAGTLVVSVPRADAAVARTFEPPPGLSTLVASLDLSGLTADDLAGVRRFAVRAPDLTPQVRARVAERLWSAIAPRLGDVHHGGEVQPDPDVLLLAVAAAASRAPRRTCPVPDRRLLGSLGRVQAYLDHAATSPLRPAARDAMLPWLGERFGNPSGAHGVARTARRAVDDARDTVADLLGCAPGEVVFLSGGTEADNTAVLGAAARPLAAPPGGSSGPIAVCSAFEHHAVVDPVLAIGGATCAVTRDGLVDLESLAATIGPSTAVVSVMAVNNEVGTIQPLDEVVRTVRRTAPQALVHTDAVQAVPWLDVAAHAAAADLVSLSAHKFGGPQGVGVLVVRERAGDVVPLLRGGGQERGRRPGTHNVAGIVGLAAALAATVAGRDHDVAMVTKRRDRLVDTLVARLDGVRESAPRARRVAGNAHLLIDGVSSDGLLFLLDRAGVCASAASACASGAQEASHVLAAMGVTGDEASGALRLSLGHDTTDAEIDHAIDVVVDVVGQLRD